MLALLPAVGAAGCGYTLAGRGSFLPDYIRTIGIPTFGNTTPYQTVEQIFTDKVRVEFQSRGRYTAVPTETGADGIVRGDDHRHLGRAGRPSPTRSSRAAIASPWSSACRSRTSGRRRSCGRTRR